MDISIDSEAILEINKQINMQKKFIIQFPFIYMLAFFICWARNNWQNLPWFFYLISLYAIIIPCFYLPLSKGLKLYNFIYKLNISHDGNIQFTTFGTLWRNERIINADIHDIKINDFTVQKLLYKKYKFNKINIFEKEFFIFSELLPYIPKYSD